MGLKRKKKQPAGTRYSLRRSGLGTFVSENALGNFDQVGAGHIRARKERIKHHTGASHKCAAAQPA